MKKTKTLVIEAKSIMSKELMSTKHDIKYNSMASKILRKVFISNCLDEIGEPFITRIASNKKIESVYKHAKYFYRRCVQRGADGPKYSLTVEPHFREEFFRFSKKP